MRPLGQKSLFWTTKGRVQTTKGENWSTNWRTTPGTYGVGWERLQASRVTVEEQLREINNGPAPPSGYNPPQPHTNCRSRCQLSPAITTSPGCLSSPNRRRCRWIHPSSHGSHTTVCEIQDSRFKRFLLSLDIPMSINEIFFATPVHKIIK